MRCEGWVKATGPFTWHQCKNEAIVDITFKRILPQTAKKTLYACKDCFRRCLDERGIEILYFESIKEKEQ